jgi:ubiquinone biosynthesis protein UbiJ
MATQFPFPWLIDEVQQRVILFVNHVLMQEPAARDRLQRQKVAVFNWCGVILFFNACAHLLA